MSKSTLFVIGLATVAASACGNAAERTAERMAEEAMREGGAEDAQVDFSDGRVRISSEEEGRRTTIEMGGEEGLSLPDGFPEDVPVIPGASVAYSMSQEGEGLSVALISSKPGKAVYDYYVEHLTEEGWEIDQKMESGGLYILHALKEEREVAVSISGEGDESTINITISEE